MGGYECVHSGRGAGQETLWVWEERAEDGAEQHSAGVEREEMEGTKPTCLRQLQGDSNNQLHHHVEDQMLQINNNQL